MTLYVTPAVLASDGSTFTADVPGQYRYEVWSVVATLHRAGGGLVGRSIGIKVTNGTTEVYATAFNDTQLDPGNLVINWSEVAGVEGAKGPPYYASAQLPRLTLDPGFSIVGYFIDGAPLDAWIAANVWWRNAS